MSEDGSKRIPFQNTHSTFFFSSNPNSNSNSNSNPASNASPNSPSRHHDHSLIHSPSLSSSPNYLNESSRRQSGTFSRVAFSIYGNSFGGGSSSPGRSSSPVPMPGSTSNPNGSVLNLNSAISPTKRQLSSGYQMPATSLSLLPSTNAYSYHDQSTERTTFQAVGEVLSCAKSNETPNLFAMATPKNLRLLKISSSEIILEHDLATQLSGGRSAKFGPISDLCFGHQQYGRHLAAATLTGSIYLYNLDRGTRVKTTLSDHQRAVNSLDFNRVNAHSLVSGSQDGKIKIWDLRMRNTRAAMSLNGNADAVRGVQFNPKKANIVCAVFDSGAVQKWDLRRQNSCERRINAHTGPVLALDWHPELESIVTGGRDKQIQVWNLGAGAESQREPNHVINTSGAVFKAKWCKGRGNVSILNTDIAVCFLNDDPCIQIWNLNRKYIPKNVIECHSNQVTQLVWKSPKYLVSCSKDKTLVQHDVTKEPKMIDNLPSNTVAWNPRGGCDLMFVKQDKMQFDKQFTEPTSSVASGNSSFNNSNDVSYSTLGSTAILDQQVQHGTLKTTNNQASTQLTPEFNSPRDISPTIPNNLSNSSLSSSYKPPRGTVPRPALAKQLSHSKHRYCNQLSAILLPAHVPLTTNDKETFKFLSTNYLIDIPDGLDITQVCEYNATLATSVGAFRDCQTWRTIKTGIILEWTDKEADDLSGQLKSYSFEKPPISESEKLGTSFGSLTEENEDVVHEKGVYSFSSINIGEKESTNDHNKLEFTRPDLIQLKGSELDESAILDEDEKGEQKHAKDEKNEKDEKDEKGRKEEKAEKTRKESGNSEIIQKNFSSTPINIQRPKILRKSFNNAGSLLSQKKYRYSFTGSSADFDDEKSASSRSVSSSPLLSRSKSKVLLMTRLDNNCDLIEHSLTGKSAETRASRFSTDTKSQLTAILKNPDNSQSDKRYNTLPKLQNLRSPWNPTDLIKEATQYSARQGDVLMCATLGLLFEKMYPEALIFEKVEEWLLVYHEILTRRALFTNAATILKIASKTHDMFKKIGQTHTSVRMFCNNCHTIILNDKSKNRLQNGDDEVEFGFWYCDKCGKRQGSCIYCNEPLKGNCVALLECGHKGHFGCLRTWIVDEDEKDCPGCGTCII